MSSLPTEPIRPGRGAPPPRHPPRDPPTERHPPRRRWSGRGPGAAGLLGALALGVVVAVVVLPDRLGVDHRTPFVQMVAFRPQIVAAVLLLALGAGVRAWRARGRGWPVAAALGLVAVLGLAVVVPRALATGPAPASGGPTLQVLSLNTYLGRADPDGVADLVRDHSPDLVALPEAGGELRRRLEARLDDDAGGSGYRSFVADNAGDQSPMTVFVKRTLGRPTVAVDRADQFPSIVVDLPRGGATGGGLRFVAVHPQSPRPGDTRQWGRDVADLARWCTSGRPTIVAGDLNSTVDHVELRDASAGCTDAASAVGAGLTGTWPSALPRVLGAQIDHVLLTGGPTAASAEVLDVAGTDHRAVLAAVRLG